MASGSDFIIKCKTERGAYTLTNLTGKHMVRDLKRSLEAVSGIGADKMKILVGYPPKPLENEQDCHQLQDVNIQSGDTLIIDTMKEAVCVQENVKDINMDADAVMAEMFPPQTGIMMRHVVPSNNSCLFTSVYFIVSNGEMNTEKSDDLRRVIAETVAGNTIKYNTAFLSMPNWQYCNWIQDPERWGGAIELAILSEHFKMEFVAIDTMSLSVHRFGESQNFTHRAFLIYDGIHYDPLVMELNADNKQTIFSTVDNVPMDMAFEIACEARSSRQYTDVANFSLICNICNAQLKGEREARAHAAETGHAEFGEVTK